MEDSDLIGLAGDPGLDFLNSEGVSNRKHLELIRDGASYLRWLSDTGLIGDSDLPEITRIFEAPELDRIAGDAVALRAWIRPFMYQWVASTDSQVPGEVIDRLNRVLATDQRFGSITATGPGIVAFTERRRWRDSRQLLVPPAEALASLLVSGDRSLIRKCESPSCTLFFYDRTKSHARRWCSMAVCGNREKVRNHRRRARYSQR
jgi:predicted RNA-binding Zn ribbon-like protein